MFTDAATTTRSAPPALSLRERAIFAFLATNNFDISALYAQPSFTPDDLEFVFNSAAFAHHLQAAASLSLQTLTLRAIHARLASINALEEVMTSTHDPREKSIAARALLRATTAPLIPTRRDPQTGFLVPLSRPPRDPRTDGPPSPSAAPGSESSAASPSPVWVAQAWSPWRPSRLCDTTEPAQPQPAPINNVAPISGAPPAPIRPIGPMSPIGPIPPASMPTPAATPDPSLAPETVASLVSTALCTNDDADSGLVTLANFLDDDATINNDPVPLDAEDPDELIEALDASAIAELLNAKETSQLFTFARGHIHNIGRAFTTRNNTRRALRFTLTREDHSAHPNCWLITAIDSINPDSS